MRSESALLLLGLAAAIAGCVSSKDTPSLHGVTTWIDRTPGAQMYTGQGEMGNGSAGNNGGAGGPSQTIGVAPKVDPAATPQQP